jgi:hypothetical protein
LILKLLIALTLIAVPLAIAEPAAACDVSGPNCHGIPPEVGRLVHDLDPRNWPCACDPPPPPM